MIDVFWPDSIDPATAASNLRVALSMLRKILQGAGLSNIIGQDGNGLYLQLSDLWIDTYSFEQKLQDATKFLAENKTNLALHEFLEAFKLYQGDLLPEDCYEDWTAPEREHLKQLKEDALVECAKLASDIGGIDQAIWCCRQVLIDNPLREDIYLLLMTCYHQQGRNSEAIQIYHQCRQQLNLHLGLKPGPQLQECFAMIIETM